MCIVWVGYFYAKSLDIFLPQWWEPWKFTEKFQAIFLNGEVCIVGGRIQVAKCKPPIMFDFEQIGEMIQSWYIF